MERPRSCDRGFLYGEVSQVLTLFEHNQKAYQAAVKLLETTGKAAVIHPTGTGKSYIAFKLCEAHPEKTVCWLSPSRYIFDVQIENLRRDTKGLEFPNIVFFTYAKLAQMTTREIGNIQPDYIILDEFHRCGAEIWGQGVEKLLARYPNAPLLGLSATNIRYLDNQRNMADELFDGNVASEITLGEAIVRGILNPPKYVLSAFSYQKDLERYRYRVEHAKNRAVQDAAGEYLQALRRALEKADGLDVIFQKHMTDRSGKYIVFCANVEHLHEMLELAPKWFAGVDAQAHYYRAYSDNPETDKAFAAFKADESEHLKLLFCVDMLNEGIHVEGISGVILLRPTVSPIIYKQQIGRALSASKKGNAVIFDIVLNIENLYSIGAIEDEMQIAMTYYREHGMADEIVNEQFKVIDEVRDCIDLFNGLNETLSASWDRMYHEAKQYFEVHGDLEVPKRYMTAEGFSLGMWVAAQRGVRAKSRAGRLTGEQVKKLDAIGMRWESAADAAWKSKYVLAKAYYAEHGNLLVGAGDVYEGVRLGSWISNLRSARKSGIRSEQLTPERIAALNDIGMVWDVPDYLWEQNYHAAVEYHRAHGNLDVPTYYVTADGIKLGSWLNTIRAARKKKNCPLKDDQIKALDKLGMRWRNKYSLQWEKSYQQACLYQKQHGDLDIPVSFCTKDGCRLGRWIRRQRDNWERLSRQQQEKLDSIGMTKEKAYSWESKFQLLKQYHAKHGDLNIPAGYQMEGVWLERWLREQTARLNGTARSGKELTAEQIKKLQSLGIYKTASRTDAQWEIQYQDAKEFYQQRGNLDVPKEYVGTRGTKLEQWLSYQRVRYNSGKLKQSRVDRLNEIGMNWQQQDLWQIGYEHAQSYCAAYGNLNVNSKFVCKDGYALGVWISNQRSAYKGKKQGGITPAQIEKLKEIGMVWDANEQRWMSAYANLQEYRKIHGDIMIPRGFSDKAGRNLYLWISEQRRAYKQGRLTPERKKLLDQIGFDWGSAG